MRLRWSRRALVKLAEARARIAEDDAAAAERLARRVLEAADRLKDFPEIGRPGRRGTRELVVVGTPYILVYRVEDEAVTVAAFFHHARRRPGG
ncbi:MAG: type II toxin-antitoxin system RelE/ParE family toxin [Myxococcales bacterium]|nr:type II toxin-antitoxin system RelE/ParE family toxin [Myxococcales bacterium]